MPEHVTMSFATMLVCDNATCGEVVSVSGHAGIEGRGYCGDNDEIDDSGYDTWLRPVSMFPAPPLFPIARGLPSKVEKELRLAFQLFWTDRSASTSRLRTCLERVLDDKGIETSEKRMKGKPRRLNLFERIDLFEKAVDDADIVESMTAMRVVGNLGTHGDEVSEGEFFDLLDVFEDMLSEIYEQRAAKLRAKKQALIALKK
jgi:hypothetical protein